MLDLELDPFLNNSFGSGFGFYSKPVLLVSYPVPIGNNRIHLEDRNLVPKSVLFIFVFLFFFLKRSISFNIYQYIKSNTSGIIRKNI